MPDPEVHGIETPLQFPCGLPGFEDEPRFRLVRHPRLFPLVLLQSEKTADLCFLALPVESIVPDYDLAVSETDCRALGVGPAASDAAELLGLAIITVPEDGPASANLMAPVVVNLTAGVGVQAVRGDQRYSHQHPLRDARFHEAAPGETPCS